MKRVLVMAVLVLSFPALQAVAIDWDAIGPALQPHSTNLPDQVTLSWDRMTGWIRPVSAASVTP